MWIVRVALNRPYTFIVLAVVLLLVGPLTIARTPTDIFPNINIPVVTAVWSYGNMIIGGRSRAGGNPRSLIVIP